MHKQKNLIEKIFKLKQQRRAIILAHNYQRPEIQAIADFAGDSLELSRLAAETKADCIVFCGVRFMAETAKILSPQKTVLLPEYDARCPMASLVNAEDVRALRKQHPKAKVICYVNTTAEVKAESDVCCTSANAVQIIKKIDAEEIIFVPDRNLAAYCQTFTDKKIIIWDKGYCYVHDRITMEDVNKGRNKWPEALLLVHPECRLEVIRLADQVLSTTGMIDYVKKSKAKKFLVATEDGILYRMKKENPDKEFMVVGSVNQCCNMKKTTLQDIFYALHKNQTKIVLKDDVIQAASYCLKAMLTYV
ncbi:MAG: quinolinate synthase NadA [Candidatus Margulisbacteria bacterium]|nr:quinolinate synthase NadA [Candidatus Margulisiibacteriota bacterium]